MSDHEQPAVETGRSIDDAADAIWEIGKELTETGEFYDVERGDLPRIKAILSDLVAGRPSLSAEGAAESIKAAGFVKRLPVLDATVTGKELLHKLDVGELAAAIQTAIEAVAGPLREEAERWKDECAANVEIRITADRLKAEVARLSALVESHAASNAELISDLRDAKEEVERLRKAIQHHLDTVGVTKETRDMFEQALDVKGAVPNATGAAESSISGDMPHTSSIEEPDA